MRRPITLVTILPRHSTMPIFGRLCFAFRSIARRSSAESMTAPKVVLIVCATGSARLKQIRKERQTGSLRIWKTFAGRKNRERTDHLSHSATGTIAAECMKNGWISAKPTSDERNMDA